MMSRRVITKVIWLAVVALFAIAAGDVDRALSDMTFGCSLGVIILRRSHAKRPPSHREGPYVEPSEPQVIHPPCRRVPRSPTPAPHDPRRFPRSRGWTAAPAGRRVLRLRRAWWLAGTRRAQRPRRRRTRRTSGEQSP